MSSLVRRLLASVLNAPIDALRRRALRSEGWSARGVEIRVAYVRGNRKPYAQHVANALGMIARHDPPRMARIQRDVAAILVWPFVSAGGVAEFHAAERVCALHSGDIKDKPAALGALSIVHEATHARLAHIPVTWDNLARIEGICFAQELAFAKRIPHGEALVQCVEGRIASLVPADFTREARIVNGLAALERDGVSRPVLAVLRFFGRITGDAGRSRPAA